MIPAYNDENLIIKTLEKLELFLKNEKDNWEVLIINDGSTDNTLEILENYKPRFFKIISYDQNKGKGFALKQGVKQATGDSICFIDSDLAYSFENLKNLLFHLKDFDVVIGSRNLHTDNHENISTLRRIFGKGFSILSNIILGYKIKDTQSGLKAFRKKAAKYLFSKQTLNGFSFDTEILYLSKKKKYKLKQVKAVVLQEYGTKDSKINFLKDPIVMFLDLLKIRLNDILGKYE
jgi:glycosyltransferase involved in cell wall biosynthesis